MAIFSNPLFATYSVYARNASIISSWMTQHLLDLLTEILSARQTP